MYYCRAVGRSENPGVPVSFGGYNMPPLVEIGLTDLQKSGGASTPMDDRPTTYLLYILPSRKLAIFLTPRWVYKCIDSSNDS